MRRKKIDKIQVPVLTSEQIKHLSRDYSKEPIKKGEQICKQDLFYLYIELNFSMLQTARYLGRRGYPVSKYLKLYEIEKTKEQRLKSNQKINLEIYGTKHPCQSEIVKQKILKTNELKGRVTKAKLTYFEKYGTNEPLTKQEKMKLTCLKKYGCENYFASKDFKQKTIQTNIQKYGVENVMQCDLIKEKSRQVCLEKYGVDNGAKLQEFKDKGKQTLIEKYGAKTYCESRFYDKELEMEKRKQTNLQKYGVEHPLQLDQFKELQKQSVYEKYGVDNVCQVPEIRQKVHDTCLKNGSYGKSKDEQKIYNDLCEIFTDVKRQYKSIEYPYSCDFYISELNLYIEYQGYQGHGKEPYDSSNEQHQNILNHWIQKDKELKTKGNIHNQYHGYIQLWTIKDPEKRKCIKENNLNWIEFFNYKQFLVWYNKIKEKL